MAITPFQNITGHPFHRSFSEHSQKITLDLPSIAFLLLAVCALLVVLKMAADIWWWKDFLKDVDPAEIDRAKQAASKSDRGILSKTLPFSEENFRYVLLYDHLRRGQITPRAMWRMKREDLDYIAGMDFPHPDLSGPIKKDEHIADVGVRHGVLTKLQGNVSRAKYELSKLNLIWATLLTALAAVFGSISGSLIG